MNKPVLEVKEISKIFPGVVANEDVSLSLNSGEILALLGENGAGKSTLMNIIYGLYQPSSGEILVRGKSSKMRSPSDAIGLGIGMVHQHFQLVPVMTVVENVMLGSEMLRNGFLDREQVSQRILDLSRDYQLEVEPSSLVEDLPVGIRQRVEILKALYRDAEILILDEPTQGLDQPGAADFYGLIERVRDQYNCAVLLVSHDLHVVMGASDRVICLNGHICCEGTPTVVRDAPEYQALVGQGAKGTLALYQHEHDHSHDDCDQAHRHHD